MKKLLLVLAVIAFATPAFAAVQNVKVSGSLTSAYVGRDGFDFGASTDDYSQSSSFTLQPSCALMLI
jgi:hypothetical protein